MTLGDKILIVILVIISLFSIFKTNNSIIDYQKTNVIVQVDGKQVAKIRFYNDKQLKTYDFKFGKGTGTLEMIDGRVRMLPMDIEICPEEICSNTGWIQNSFQMIVCLPNKIIVTIETNEEEEVDLIVMR